mmetsp:Transcript_30004/g.92785  ORF Transcript_30004/g.92785 Transcript_30004/m.92785 type:complete len:522 (+) Transcript_30004:99-1664(+)
MASDTQEKEELVSPSRWILAALALLLLVCSLDLFFDIDVPGINDDAWGDGPEVPPRIDTLPGPTPALFALRAELERERADATRRVLDAARRVEDLAPLGSLVGHPLGHPEVDPNEYAAEHDRPGGRRVLAGRNRLARPEVRPGVGRAAAIGSEAKWAAAKWAAAGYKSENDAKWASPIKPLWGFEHDRNADAVMSLGFGYRTNEYARFVSTLRYAGYEGDIVLAAGPRFQRGVEEYLQSERVLAYRFTYHCKKKPPKNARPGRKLLVTPGGCVLDDWYAEGDSRGPRPLAVARYEMYRTWLSFYSSKSWAIAFDFRDTFFQRDPFALVDRSKKAPNLLLFAENRAVKTFGNCPFNGAFLRCFLSKPEVKKLANESVACSGSTMGSVPALKKYVERMVAQMDASQCSAAGFGDSDQGYHNYLYHTGELDKLSGVRVHLHEQGDGVINTIGAMNGYRVPAHMKGPLDTKWKIRDPEGYILNNDGTRSPVVHQWDRFYKEVFRFIDGLAKKRMVDLNKKSAAGG